jgi:predicted glycosyltransferase
MTAESALMGIPTISYNAIPNSIEKMLVRKKLIKRETDPEKISKCIKKILKSPNNVNQKRAKNIMSQMENPIQKLIKVIKD